LQNIAFYQKKVMYFSKNLSLSNLKPSFSKNQNKFIRNRKNFSIFVKKKVLLRNEFSNIFGYQDSFT
jgi:hypothetical protein